MPVHRGFRAWLKTGGDVLEEYGVEQDTHNERVYTCWIASEAGQQFTIHWETLTRVDHHTKISADGIQVSHKAVISSIEVQGRSLGVHLNEHEIRPYVFSDINLTDDEFALTEPSNAAEIGCIKVEIYTGSVVVAKGPSISHSEKGIVELSDGPLHEKSKKLGGHRIILGDTIKYEKKVRYFRLAESNLQDPHVIFKFIYRPHAYLRAQGIIPSSLKQIIPAKDQSQQRIQKRKRIGDSEGPLGPGEGSSAITQIERKKAVPVKREEEDTSVLNNGSRKAMNIDRDADEDKLLALERQMEVMREEIAQLRQKRVKREPSSFVKTELSFTTDSGDFIDLTLD